MPIEKPWFDAWVDDDGSGVVGTIWNKTEIKKMIDGLDGSEHVCVFYAPADVAIVTGWSTPNLYGLDSLVPASGWNQTPGSLYIPPSGGGLYFVFASLAFKTAAGNLRAAMVQRNGIAMTPTQFGPATIPGGGDPGLQIATIMQCSGGHQLTVAVYTDTATSLAKDSRFGVCRL
jgi:hypothetical protein